LLFDSIREFSVAPFYEAWEESKEEIVRPRPSRQAEAWLSLEAGAFDFVPAVRIGSP
jgi:hypothetical protein